MQITSDEQIPSAREPVLTPVDAVKHDLELCAGDIARLAYKYWQERGGQNGSPEEDWLRAERVLRSSALESAASETAKQAEKNSVTDMGKSEQVSKKVKSAHKGQISPYLMPLSSTRVK